MQKKVIALAVAGLMSGAAFAQSNVTVYGLLDMGYRAGSTENGAVDQKKTGIDSNLNNTSRIGFKGEENLGNGLKAVFQLEYALTPDVNSGIGRAGDPARDTYVGLAGNFGTVVAGRLTSPGDTIASGYSATDNGNTFDATATLLGGTGNTFGGGAVTNGSTMGARLNNAVAYISPTMSGFTVIGAYSFAGSGLTTDAALADSADQERILGMSVNYANGAFGAGYAYHRVTDAGIGGGAGANASGPDLKEHAFGVSYDLGVAKLFGQYFTAKIDGSDKDKLWSLGATAPVGANGLVRVQYAKFNEGDAGVAGDDATSWALRYDHNLSKRTMVYGGYVRVSNGGNALTGATISNNAVGSGTVVGGSSNSGYGFGIQHVF